MTPDGLSPDDLTDLLHLAVRAAQAGARTAQRWQHDTRLRVEQKSAAYDLVSQADRDTEEVVREVLTAARPEDGFLGEEGGVQHVGELTWVVDPIDGTTNYLYGLPAWAVSVAAVAGDATSGEGPTPVVGVVLEPALGMLTAAVRGGGTTCNGEPVQVRATTDLGEAVVDIGLGDRARRHAAGRLVTALDGEVRDLRRHASAASALAMVATGRLEAYWGPGVRVWDVAAGALLVTEAGGLVGDLDRSGATVPVQGACLAAGPALFPALQGLLRQVYAVP